jgi:hypothetical protein
MGGEPISVSLGRMSLNPLEALRIVRELRAVLSRVRPHVMIAYTIKPIVLAASAAKAEGVRRFVPLVTGLGYAFTGGREPSASSAVHGQAALQAVPLRARASPSSRTRTTSPSSGASGCLRQPCPPRWLPVRVSTSTDSRPLPCRQHLRF